MSNSSRYALRAFRSIQSSTRPRLESVTSQFPRQQTKLSSRRNFISQPRLLAQAAAAPAKSSATADAANTENSLKTEAPPASLVLDEGDPNQVDWSRSFHGLGNQAFPKEAADVLLAPIDPNIVEIKPDGIVYLPEIHYRKILNRAFGPGAWGLAPRGETIVTDKAVTREYALIAHGR